VDCAFIVAATAVLILSASPTFFKFELATGRVRPTADKGLLDPRATRRFAEKVSTFLLYN
jgi:hypothetical protein